jgi:uncharacterized protein YndB with AHSA1/START domain
VDARSSPDKARAGEVELVITRVFDAPRRLVFKAWTDPAHLTQWLGPRRYPAVSYDSDFRQGGAWRACLRSPSGAADLWQGGVFREIVANERLVFTFAWDRGHPAHGSEMLVTITFADEGEKTRMVFRQSALPSIEARNDHQAGWNSSFDRLNDHLAKAS